MQGCQLQLRKIKRAIIEIVVSDKLTTDSLIRNKRNKMKATLKFIFLLLPIFTFGQQKVCVYNNYEVLGNDTINLTVDNVKEGLWINYEISYESIECFTPKKCYHQRSIKFINSKGEYLHGKKRGEWNYFYETGEIKRKVFYNDYEEKVGKSTEYFKNVKVKSEQNWNNGKIESQLVFYENGFKKYESKFQNGNIVSFTIFYKSGKIKYRGKDVNKWEIGEILSYKKNGEERFIRPKKLGELLADEGLIEYL